MAASDLIKTVFIVRHGERLDHIDKLWQPDPSQGIWDPPLTPLGYEQAKRTGDTLSSMMKEQQHQEEPQTTEKGSPPPTNVIIYTSPFQRCVDTALGLTKGLYSQSIKDQHHLSITLKLDFGLAEWMSEKLFEDGIHCSASQFMIRQQEKLARQQAYTYSTLATRGNHLNTDMDDASLLPPTLHIDYAYQNPEYTEFDFPEDYNDMIQRFEETRRLCLENAVAPVNSYNAIATDTLDTVVIFVTHAVGVNALLDGFRNQATIPLESNYCSISCLKRLSFANSSSSMLTYASDQSDAQSEEDEVAEYFDEGVEDRRKINTSFFRQQRPTHELVAAKEMWSVQCTMSDSHLLHTTL